MRRVVLHDGGRGLGREDGREGSVEVFEALGALRLAAKRMHDAMERFAEGHGLSESRLRVLTRLCHHPSRQLPLGALAEGRDGPPPTLTAIIDVRDRDGLGNRVPVPAERRLLQADITDTGLELITAM